QDDDFGELGNERRVRYTNLAPGDYRFVVKAANDSGVWNEAGASLALTIPPAFHQTTWFRALCVAAPPALPWGLHRVRGRAVERHERQLMDAQEKERTRIAGDLHDGVLQQLSVATLNLGMVKQQLPRDSRATQEIVDVQNRLVDVGRDIRYLSHELH